jgi:tetratricopeptide (TPR) repeat protein
MATNPAPLKDRRGRVYTPAIGRGLRPWLWCILIGFALLAANGVYLGSVTFLGWLRGSEPQTFFSLAMLVAHVALGLLFVVPFVIFGFAHLITSWKRPNKAAIRYGLLLLGAGVVVLSSGFLLLRLELPLGDLSAGRLPNVQLVVNDAKVRSIGYWLHVLVPLAAIALYVRHRLAGPMIKWQWARVWVVSVAVFVAVMAVLHSHDPRAGRKPNDPRYTFPSSVQLAGGKLIPEDVLMMDDYCLKCHQDAYKGWFHSAHHFSSFNNKPYLKSVRETRKIANERDGSPRAARWCAGCHDPVPFWSGAFDDPNYDDVNTKSSQAGITCTACHAITHLNSTRGNADFRVEEPQHYIFAESKNPFLQWVNNTLVKAKPAMHRRTFLKPEVHRNTEFCSSCHKVHLPFALNNYKDFLRGQNHWEPFVLSGVAGGNAKSFYYPDVAKQSCNECHMPLQPSADFGAKDFDGKGENKIHNHMFVGANTGLASIRGREDIAKIHADFLADKKARIDIFGIRDGGTIEGKLEAPLRPAAPTLQPGRPYLVETVVRTLGIGHPLSQGTADSNEIWVELIARSDGKIIGRSGGIDELGAVDPYAHFINVYMLDRHGKRIDRRNPQDIFVPLYNKQIPPGAGQVVHFLLNVPESVTGPIELEARLNYRKFDRTYMDFVFGENQGPDLPVVLMAKDALKLAVEGGGEVKNEPSAIKDTWQRWNDYGIGLLLEGGTKGAQKGELRQAEHAFQMVADKFDKPDGWINLGRVYLREGRNDDALAALQKATDHKDLKTPWVINWLAAQVDERNGLLDSAIAKYNAVLETKDPVRHFDFGRDYEVRNALGKAFFGRYKQEDPASPARATLLAQTIDTYRRALAVDSENVESHYGLALAYAEQARALGAERGDGSQAERPVPTPETLDELVARVESLSKNNGASAHAALGTAATALAGDVPRFVNTPRPEFGSRLEPLLKITERLADACRDQSDPKVKATLAQALAAAHSSLHQLYKPDETAEGIAQKVARRDNPAADFNANSIVIHNLQRPGAPGVDRPGEAAAAAAPANLHPSSNAESCP